MKRFDKSQPPYLYQGDVGGVGPDDVGRGVVAAVLGDDDGEPLTGWTVPAGTEGDSWRHCGAT